MKIPTLVPVVLAGLVASAFAAPLTFDFKDPKGVNNITFKLDAPLESISGSTNGITGTVTVDPATMTGITGKIVVTADSLKVPNPMMEEHMKGDKWLDAKKFPEISFELKAISDLDKNDNGANGKATGTFTLHGVSKDITVPARVTYLPGRLKDRVPDAEGDLLVIRADFSIKRGDFGIQPKQNEDKVSNQIRISLAIAGAAPKAAPVGEKAADEKPAEPKKAE
jgi:polyisoprenoid-binding protein YceI